MSHPYRPLFIEGKPDMIFKYTLTNEELEEAVHTYIEEKMDVDMRDVRYIVKSMFPDPKPCVTEFRDIEISVEGETR